MIKRLQAVNLCSVLRKRHNSSGEDEKWIMDKEIFLGRA